MPQMTSRQRVVFLVVATAAFFENYDGALLSLALKQIQQELAIADANLAAMLAVIQLGYALSLFVTPLADRFGRRRLLLYTIAGYTAATALSALAPNGRAFVLLQVVARTCSGAEAVLAVVILAEEMDASVRGSLAGLLGWIGGLSWGLAALVFAFVNVLPFGWRALYAFSLVILVPIIPMRRALPETRRFIGIADRVASQSLIAPAVKLLKSYPSRFILITATAALIALGQTGFLFGTKYLEDTLRWTPPMVSTLYMTVGALAGIGPIVGGWASDKVGRKVSGATVSFVAGLAWIGFFNTARRAVVVPYAIALFASTASIAILRIYSAELFPTSYRSTAASLITVSFTIGQSLSLLAEAQLFRLTRSHWTALTWLITPSLGAPLLILLAFPETARRELEAIADEA